MTKDQHTRLDHVNKAAADACPICMPSSNELAQRLRTYVSEHVQMAPAALMYEAAVELDRLTRERDNIMRGYQNFVDDAGKREDRLTSALREATSREAMLRAAEVTRAMEAVEYGDTIKRLRAALERIIATESVDNDGEPMPETGACFIAREALREDKA